VRGDARACVGWGGAGGVQGSAGRERERGRRRATASVRAPCMRRCSFSAVRPRACLALPREEKTKALGFCLRAASLPGSAPRFLVSAALRLSALRPALGLRWPLPPSAMVRDLRGERDLTGNQVAWRETCSSGRRRMRNANIYDDGEVRSTHRSIPYFYSTSIVYLSLMPELRAQPGAPFFALACTVCGGLPACALHDVL
jgi:hypothetical protein